jgi:D-glycero-D-manno-heptose 1,7-bisphosphate phosphatase
MNTVFLDRDGVINRNRDDHVKTWEEFSFLPQSLMAIARLSRAGFRIFVITNQAVINRGLVARDTVDDINEKMMSEVARWGGRIEATAYCPHRPDEDCSCRKPRPGLLLDLARVHGLDLSQSVVVGDALSDIQAGQAAGCQTILVLTGRGREQLRLARASGRNGFRVAGDLFSATDVLLDWQYLSQLRPANSLHRERAELAQGASW